MYKQQNSQPEWFQQWVKRNDEFWERQMKKTLTLINLISSYPPVETDVLIKFLEEDNPPKENTTSPKKRKSQPKNLEEEPPKENTTQPKENTTPPKKRKSQPKENTTPSKKVKVDI